MVKGKECDDYFQFFVISLQKDLERPKIDLVPPAYFLGELRYHKGTGIYPHVHISMIYDNDFGSEQERETVIVTAHAKFSN